ncbi:multidrug DMT transporter permease [Streptomyces sp. NPDC056704]|uniref:multidrug DMT transporter permease n=1 Tax=Streptomyces sp. NPDC056704 TaxID=3345917 RepID=UPI00369CBBEA
MSGIGSAAAMLLLNRGRGAMSVVMPVSAVMSVFLSVLGGVLVLGDRPTPLAWSGITVTAPALWLLSSGRTTSPKHQDATTKRVTGDGLLASLGVAIQYLALAQAGPSSGLWPVGAGRLAAVIVLVPAAQRHQQLPAIRSAQAILTGAGAALALILYLLATERQMLAVAVVRASLYPALPVVLGLTVLHEQVDRCQVAGLLGATAVTVLLALG